MLGLGGFGHRKKPREFGYTPRYFDVEAEARAERRRLIEGDAAVDSTEYRPGVLIREGRMRRMQVQADKAHRNSKSTLIRTAVFVVLVFGILWLMTNYFEISLLGK